jgi:ferredoxin-NADP reductase
MMFRNQDEELELVVQAKREIAVGVASFALGDRNGAELPPWEPGAHIDVCMPGVTRQYSLCGDPGDAKTYRIAVLLDPNSRGGSRHMHEVLKEGDTVIVRPPRNHFKLSESDAYLFIAGGIGITPLLPMIASANSAGRPWSLLYGGRSADSMAYADWLTSTYGEKVAVRPQDQFGLLDLNAVIGGTNGSTRVYCCGPEPLIAAVEASCLVHSAELHTERFAPRPTPILAPQTPFAVYCKDSDVTIGVDTGQSMLDALINGGIDVNYECREGTCGTCELDLIEGEGLHLDSIIAPEERKDSTVIFPCVSRALSARLVLDV